MVNERTLVIEPRDPVIFREGKPFDLGLMASSLPFATPAAVIGSVRTRLGAATNYDDATVDELLKVAQTGPFLVYREWNSTSWEVSIPAPSDVMAYEIPDKADLEWVMLRPGIGSAGTDLPEGLSALEGARDEKTSRSAPAFWKSEAIRAWLAQGGPGTWIREPGEIGLTKIERQRRVHVSIDPGMQTAAEGMLFGTEGLEFQLGMGTRLGIATRIQSGYKQQFPEVSHIGGEGRTAFWREGEHVNWPQAPQDLREAKKIRLLLVTPAAFDEGWKPGWLKDGIVPDTDVKLKLVAASVPRAMPLSGWDLRAKTRGPKATRMLAPAGSVYFCEVESGNVADLWMKPVSDREQDRRDGFGIVICGAWT